MQNNSKSTAKKPALLLSGTPASGKDTITNILLKLDKRFKHFKKHRANGTKTNNSTYIDISQTDFERLITEEKFVQFHSRYGRYYGVALSELQANWQRGEIPIIHVGKYSNIANFTLAGIDIFSVLLLVNKDETRSRLHLRHQGDEQEIKQRLKAYQEERDELAKLIASGVSLSFSSILDNSGNKPYEIAQWISKSYQ